MPEDEEDPDYCRIATITAFELAREECGDDEMMMKHIAKMMGIKDFDMDEKDKVLEEGIEEIDFGDITQVRKWVMSRAWEMIESDETDHMDEALEQAWEEIEEEM